MFCQNAIFQRVWVWACTGTGYGLVPAQEFTASVILLSEFTTDLAFTVRIAL
jgi:hypothetical protein